MFSSESGTTWDLDAAASSECGVADGRTEVDRGDHAEEVSRLIKQELPFLGRTARRWQRNAADADDLVQETVLRVLANAHLWQPGTNFCAWVRTIMRNQFFTGCAKSTRNRETLAELAEGSMVASGGGTPYFRLMLRDLQAAVSRLPEKQRAAVRLGCVEGLSYEEVAHRMGLSIGAVRCHLARARERLRNAVLAREETSPLAVRPTSKRPARQATARGNETDLRREPAQSAPSIL